jgi:hypothetical protein
VRKRGRRVLGIEHIGSAHTDDELAVLLRIADERRHAGQLALDLDDAGEAAAGKAAVVEGTSSLILWEALAGIYADLGLDRLGDDAFRALVLARVIEPASKLDTVRVLTDLGVASPHRVTFMRCLKRVAERDYRAVISRACYARATRTGTLAVVLYDVTTLHFEVEREDKLRKVGMSKEHRVDPQVTVGLLTTAGGFPLEIDLFEGNKAETKTLIPVLTRFRDRYQARDIVVVADAGMLSAANLLALEENGFQFIVGSRPARSPTTCRPMSRGTATTWPTARRSRPPGTWALGRRPVTGGWSTSTRSSAPSTTTVRSTPWSNALRRSPPANGP